MAIDSIPLLSTNSISTNQTNEVAKKVSPFEAQTSFANTLKDAISSVNEQQIKSDQLTTKLVNGEDVDLHEVMIAAQKASISLNATIEVRNKVIEAYQEIMRMSI